MPALSNKGLSSLLCSAGTNDTVPRNNQVMNQNKEAFLLECRVLRLNLSETNGDSHGQTHAKMIADLDFQWGLQQLGLVLVVALASIQRTVYRAFTVAYIPSWMKVNDFVAIVPVGLHTADQPSPLLFLDVSKELWNACLQ